MTVYILWEYESNKQRIEGVYLDKIRAEEDLRCLKDTADDSCRYRIQKKEITP